MSNQEMPNERARLLLSTLIQRYVDDGRPVGSTTLAREAGLELSPATIRNIMADLENLGLVVSPHTSAGRIPTVKGYRLFVDTLLTANSSLTSATNLEVDALMQQLRSGEGGQELVSSVSDMLSGMTNMAGLVTLPKHEVHAWRHIEFLPLSDKKVLSIMVLNDREVQNRVLDTARPYSPAELQQAANYLNQAFAGKSLGEVRRTLLREMREAKERMDKMMLDALEIAGRVCEGDPDEDFVMAGQTKLMNFAELSNVEKLRELFDAFGEKRDILHLLDQCQQAQGVQIFIGEESGYKPLDECSMVASPYRVEGEVVGVLGVIGPTRMAYDRVIPIVDITARLLGSVLNTRH
jgi:heat-inducible transcriptional repressor